MAFLSLRCCPHYLPLEEEPWSSVFTNHHLNVMNCIGRKETRSERPAEPQTQPERLIRVRLEGYFFLVQKYLQ